MSAGGRAGVPRRRRGLSIRAKLALSYAGFLMVTSGMVLAVVWLFLLRYVPEQAAIPPMDNPNLSPVFIPGRDDLWEAFAPRAAWALGFLLILGLGGGWLLAGRMLAPLTQIRAATQTAMGGSLSHRIRLPGPRDEFRDLADSFDEMLERLEAHVAEQQRFAANASHELRTPLAISQTLLEVARNDPQLDPVQLIDRLHAVNVRAIDLTEALLMLSRADRRTFASEPVDLSLLVDEAVETLLPLAEKRRITFYTSGDVARVMGSRALLLQMVTNLLHNAVVHNLPDDGGIWVTTRAHRRGVELSVENSGEPLPDELVATLTEPFRRGTDRVRSEQAGVGLGLTIVRSIVQAHDGALRLAPRPDGGLRISVQLPSGQAGSVVRN
ncbi:Sensor protein CzcS precursor [Arthrobacter saudimassiliensis]|uniref:histidine kinase n=1 Tax=Arthrobacter saudimassiliensis TaxID=1461584 RepID=A0A078MKU2_9MICC|nr:Sensor protein CzcS precursor [Arthrobacter saudimassiliensis]